MNRYKTIKNVLTGLHLSQVCMSRGDIMKNLLPGIWQWSWFSEEKQLDFNGLFLTVGEHKILIDPPPMTGEASSMILRNGQSITSS